MSIRKETTSIGFACALGAFIGALLALEFKARFQYGIYLLPVGAFIGGSVAYVAIDFRDFCFGIVRAYRATIAWKPYVPFWKTYGILFLGANTILATFCIILFAVSKERAVLDICIVFSIFHFFLSYIFPIETIDHCKNDYLRAKSIGFGMLKYGNPFGVAYLGLQASLYVIQTLWRMFLYVLKAIPTALVLTKQFVIKTFVYVHSDRRAICFVDSAIGALIGFFCGSAFIGALAGIMLGIANYEFVTVRWLKLVPVKG